MRRVLWKTASLGIEEAHGANDRGVKITPSLYTIHGMGAPREMNRSWWSWIDKARRYGEYTVVQIICITAIPKYLFFSYTRF